jgi:hypothetical protein
VRTATVVGRGLLINGVPEKKQAKQVLLLGLVTVLLIMLVVMGTEVPISER